MKDRLFGLLLLLINFSALAQTNMSPLQIIGFSSGQLRWTNHLAANVPMYQILKAPFVDAVSWEHFAFVTNATSALVTNSATPSVPQVFHKVEWFADAFMVFSYEFDEGLGFGPCVTGQLTLSFLTNGTWNFSDGGLCFNGVHAVGSGTLRPRSYSWTLPHTARFDLTSPPNSQFIEATFQSTINGGSLVYTGMVGTVYQNGFAGATPIGTFRSRRLQ